MTPFDIPGVYVSDVPARSTRALTTGVPVFLGYASSGPVATDRGAADPLSATTGLRSWADFVQHYGASRNDAYLEAAVRGFFENGGTACYVLRLADDGAFKDAVGKALDVLERIDGADLVCIPDAALHPDDALAAQQLVLDRIAADHRMALLDSLPGHALDEAVRQRQQLRGATSEGGLARARNGALYFPWVHVPQAGGSTRPVPPCGHVAGMIARTDRQAGVFKPPANEAIEGVVDLDADVGVAEQRQHDPDAVVNCLRALPGRGIRVWGARTTSGEPDWRYVNVRRLVLTLARWFELLMADVVMEPNGPALWTRIRREVNDYLFKLFRAGALRGATPQEAYFLKCDQETTSVEARERGEVCVRVGIAPVVPAEFIVVRLRGGTAGVLDDTGA